MFPSSPRTARHELFIGDGSAAPPCSGLNPKVQTQGGWDVLPPLSVCWPVYGENDGKRERGERRQGTERGGRRRGTWLGWEEGRRQ